MLSYMVFLLSLFLFCFLNLWWELMCYLLFLILFLFSSISFFDYFCMLSYEWGVDYISADLLILGVWIKMLMFMSSMGVNWFKTSSVLFSFLILCLLMVLLFVFCSYNLFLFYFFFESSLIPTMFLIVGWGYQPERLTSILYLLIYTLVGSLPLLLIIFWINFIHCSGFMFFTFSGGFSLVVYYGLILAFLISIPLFGFHLWLLSAHLEAPVSGSMILAGVLLKLGGYGLMRMFGLVGFISSSVLLPWFLVGIVGGWLVGCFCLMQVDMKLLIAYSSVAHMGYVVSGIMSFSQWGFTGSLVMMIGHGLCSSGLFCLSNISYGRLGSRSLLLNRGVLSLFPSLSMFWFLFCSSNMASPPSLNLIGEVFLGMGIVSWSFLSVPLLMMGCFLGGAYSLYLFSSSQHGKFYSGVKSFSSVSSCEFMLLILHWLPLNLLILIELYYL
uniref:NADH-ubiquinone oxidoreductase chain 4 n=1 Tax=Hackeriella veitchi TaxID=60873 RepID=L7N6I2_9HEMI|nr:NADH dehydrogenase subunit 4 [Hackeriella veitchi]ACV96708.1 NADH dehydrogenase subunit 4 [Hackeriella veitchi]